MVSILDGFVICVPYHVVINGLLWSSSNAFYFTIVTCCNNLTDLTLSFVIDHHNMDFFFFLVSNHFLTIGGRKLRKQLGQLSHQNFHRISILVGVSIQFDALDGNSEGDFLDSQNSRNDHYQPQNFPF